MDIFSQKKLMSRIIIFLVVLNLATLSFFVYKEIAHRGPLLFPKNEAYKDVSSILQKELQLTNKQLEAFNKIRENYFKKEVSLKQIIRDEKDQMNVEMFNSKTNDSLIITLAKSISANEYKMELLRYDQAKELKLVCTPKQQDRFQNLVIEIRDYFRPDNQPQRK